MKSLDTFNSELTKKDAIKVPNVFKEMKNYESWCNLKSISCFTKRKAYVKKFQKSLIFKRKNTLNVLGYSQADAAEMSVPRSVR